MESGEVRMKGVKVESVSRWRKGSASWSKELKDWIERGIRGGAKGSSSDGDGGNGKWKWDGENWWYKVEYQATVNSRLGRRISRLVQVALEQEVMRRRDGGQRPRSEIEWLKQRK